MAGLWNGLRARLWYVYPPVVLTVDVPPIDCLRAMMEATRPSTDRLHLRNLFAEGRRYFLQPMTDGFLLTSNSKIPWRRRARTSIAAVMTGELSSYGDGGTRLMLRARMRLLYFLDIFFLPSLMTSLLIFAPWPPALISGLAALLYALSFTWHRLTASLQAADMVYFVQKSLEEFTPGEVVSLGGTSPDVITQERDFREQWQKFYEAHKRDDEQ
jgi:hypothetical protein